MKDNGDGIAFAMACWQLGSINGEGGYICWTAMMNNNGIGYKMENILF